MKVQVGKELQDVVQSAYKQIQENNCVAKIWEHDHTVWSPQPNEIENRLGWLHSPENMKNKIPEITSFVEDIKAAGFTHALLLGMGGSSLAPEVFRRTFGVKERFIDLEVLDSTHPEAVLSLSRKLDPVKTLFLVSTKSGGTIETLSFFKYFYNWVERALGSDVAGAHFTAITDPGSSLEEMANKLNFRKVFTNDPNIGGRFSALSYFGLVPAALIGVDAELLLNRAQQIAEKSRAVNIEENESALLGATLGELALHGKDKMTFIMSEQIECFGAWAEQLVAESTGKEGKGILPVDLEEPGDPDVYGDDRVFVVINLANELGDASTIRILREAGFPFIEIKWQDLYDLGAELFRWEFATAIAGQHLGIQPFDQPDVESAKVQARKMVSAYFEKGSLPGLIPAATTDGVEIYADFPVEDLQSALSQFFSSANRPSGQYLAIQAYIQPTSEAERALQELRHKIRDKYKMAVTVGFGPRFLHSTGQLHKGDSGHGLFLQITANRMNDAEIPDKPGSDAAGMTFGVLIDSQTMGDRQALIDKNRKVLRLHFTGDVHVGLKQLKQMINQ